MTVKEFFSLRLSPFGKNIGQAQLFQYDQLEHLSTLIQATLEDGSMCLITGRAGTGKTTGVRAYLEALPSARYRIIYVGQEQRRSGVISRILHELGSRTNVSWANRTLKLSERLQDTIRSGRQLILVIDEAHLLEQQTLEDIRLLTNLDMDRSTNLSVFLLGQHWLRAILKKTPNEALYQRLRLRLALEGLSELQTAQYIHHHLALAGCSDPESIFTDDAITEIFASSEGILREINNICFEAMLRAASLQTRSIGKSLIEHVLNQRELN